MSDHATMLAVALAAAKTAGLHIAKRHAEIHAGSAVDLHIGTKMSATDLVTDVDREAQRIIIEIIQQSFPDHRFLAEEEGASELGDPHSPFVWIIDPLDGTTNFIHGREDVGTIIALQKNGVTELGVMWMPLKNVLFQCIRGQGAFVNDRPVRLRETKNTADAILSSNITHRAVKDAKGILQTPIPYCGSLQNYGCAAWELGEVLLGHNDGVVYRGPRLWDVAASCLMIEEAGGRSRTELEDPKDPRGGVLCVASTAPIFEELCDFVFTKRAA